MTLEAWVNPSAGGGWRTAVLKEFGTSSLAYALYSSNGTPGRPDVSVNVNGDHGLAANASLPLNAWTHLAATFDGSTARLYVNGGAPTTLAASGALATTAGPLRIGGNAVWGDYFSGLIDDVRVYNRPLSAAEIQTDMNTPVGPPPPPDSVSPTVSLTAPVDGTNVSGTVQPAATAADNVAVVGVQFKLDGVNLGAEDTAAPYSVSWNTATAALGA